MDGWYDNYMYRCLNICGVELPSLALQVETRTCLALAMYYDKV